jgi:hypothetical protein
VAANAPATTGVTIDFRNMLHKIHRGKDLDAGDDYVVVGFGFGYPNNFTPHTYEEVGFPVLPGSTSNCRNCHGEQNTAWQVPRDVEHPDQSVPQRSWSIACSSCHDDTAAVAHINANTDPFGAESCAVCHGPVEALNVDLVHKVR